MSWRQLLAVALTDLRRVLRRRDTLLWLLIMPLPYTYFFGLAFHEAPEEATPIVVVAPEPDAGSARIEAALEAAGYAVTTRPAWTAEKPLPRHGYRVDLPPRLATRLVGGEKGTVELWSRTGAVEAQRIRVVVEKVVLTLRAEALARLARGETVKPERLAEPLTVIPIEVVATDWGERREIPSGFKQTVPGNMVMFVLLAVLVTGAIRLLLDREAGHLTRMLVWPISPMTIVVSQLLSLALVGLFEAVYFLLVARLAFGQAPGPHPFAVLGVLALLVLAASGAGVLLACSLSNAKQAAAVGIFTTLALAALGGCWWPMEILPNGLKLVALALPTGEAMHALVRLMVWHDPPSALGGYLVYMVLLAVATTSLAATVLRRRLG